MFGRLSVYLQINIVAMGSARSFSERVVQQAGNMPTSFHLNRSSLLLLIKKLLISLLIGFNIFPSFLAYFPYFEKIKVDL
jgi:hypothetical protein